MSRRLRRKSAVRTLLQTRDEAGIRSFARESRNPTNVLFSFLYDPDELLRWRAVEAIGVACSVMARRDVESVREIIRRVIWHMNDESGGVIWNGPEVIAEILVRVPALMSEYAQLLPGFLREEPFERGAAWAVARIAVCEPDELRARAAELVPFLGDRDPYIAGYTTVALKALSEELYRRQAGSVVPDPAPLTVYDLHTGKLLSTTAGRLDRSVFAGPSCRTSPVGQRSAGDCPPAEARIGS